MTKSIRHLRGDTDSWYENDIVIPDGELAICRTYSGGTVLKIGDGMKRFSELEPLGDHSKYKYGLTGFFTLENNCLFKLDTPRALKIQTPDMFDDNFSCLLSFTTGAGTLPVEILGKIYFSGDDTAGGDFIPEPKRNYNIFIWNDGNFQAVVRGVPLV